MTSPLRRRRVVCHTMTRMAVQPPGSQAVLCNHPSQRHNCRQRGTTSLADARTRACKARGRSAGEEGGEGGRAGSVAREGGGGGPENEEVFLFGVCWRLLTRVQPLKPEHPHQLPPTNSIQPMTAQDARPNACSVSRRNICTSCQHRAPESASPAANIAYHQLNSSCGGATC